VCSRLALNAESENAHCIFKNCPNYTDADKDDKEVDDKEDKTNDLQDFRNKHERAIEIIFGSICQEIYSELGSENQIAYPM